ncbi:MAG: UDP-2,3-diacylglucosamine diphosphatase [Pseudomonadota bacterium]
MSNQATGFTLFIADLHLAEERPQASGRFFHFLESIAPGADALYILGDLFEYWAGDDDADAPLARQSARKIKTLTASGTPVHFMHGNRDFLLAQRYADSCGMVLLSDPAAVDLYGTRTLLTHGDMLCTDDRSYQRFRKLVRQPLVRHTLLALPLGLRHAMARSARSGSERAKAGKSYEIMDVNADAVAAMFRQSGAARMIHGHTHRPAQHALTIDGRPGERWVLPDWYGEGGYLACTAGGCELLPLPSSTSGSSNNS